MVKKNEHKKNAQVERVRHRLEELCEDSNDGGIDLGGWPTRVAAVSAAIGVAAALGACYGGPPPMPESPDGMGDSVSQPQEGPVDIAE